MKSLGVDRDSSLPPYVQLKEQIKLAYTVGQLKQGDVLPSIRALAGKLGIGEAAVRRAYTELRELGLLSTEHRKYVAVNRNLITPPNMESVAADATVECRRLLAWAHKQGLSTISLARLLVREATASETSHPSYLYLDASLSSAEQFAKTIAATWEIKVVGMSIEQVRQLPSEDLRRYTAILVNYYRYESLLTVLGGRRKCVYPVKLRVGRRLINRIRRLPAGSRVLMVFAEEDFTRMGRPVVESYRALVGTKWLFEPIAFGRISDLAAVADSGTYGLIIVSAHVWDRVPEKARRSANVALVQNELDMQSLEQVRIAAGILV